MKHYIFLFAILLFSVTAFAQQPKLSPLTRKYVQDMQSKKSTDLHLVLKKTEGTKTYSGGIIKVSDAPKAQKSLTDLGIHIGTKAGNIWTIQIPTDKIADIGLLQGITYIQLDEPVRPDLNIARQTTHADSVQKGIELNMPFGGKDVVVGVIDFGFDYTHPAFYDTTGNQYRIKRVWELNGTGTPPAGYNYGNELTDTTLIKQQGTDNSQQTHGTCTAGIAAGSGFGSSLNSRFRGMAYDADIVLVGVRRDSIEQQWLQGGFSDFIDGINYIFTYAQSVGKPAVVNISWGSQSGAHDGNSLFNEACNNLSGSGRIIVMSAGNEGQEKIHLTKNFTTTDTTLYTFLDFVPQIYKRTWIDIWGDTSKTFCAEATLYSNGIAGNTTGIKCINNQIESTYLISNNGIDTCFVEFISSDAEYNGKPRMTINIFNKAPDSIGITLKGTEGTIHLWNEYYYYGYTHGFVSDFNNQGFAWAQTGDTVSTVSDMGSAQSVLLAGAYNSKISWRNIAGVSLSRGSYAELGKMAPFSSHGPMIDGRIKPDIAAPGYTIATAVSSFSSTYIPGGSNSDNLVATYTQPVTNKKYYYSEFIGTSASAPAAAGIVALMLQANPYLWPGQVQEIIQQTAITDNYTGALPSNGDNTWGHGKINAYGAVKMAIQKVGIYQFAGKKLDYVIYPNPNNGNFTVDIEAAKIEKINITVYDITGRNVYSSLTPTNVGINKVQLSLTELPKGLYIVKVNSEEGTSTSRIVIE